MFVEILALVARGVPMTVFVTLVSLAAGIVIAIPLALGLRSTWAVVRFPSRAVVNVMRAVPILMWLFLLYFGVSIGAFHFEPLQATLIVLSLVTGCYLADVFRTSFEAIDSGQFEASRSIGLTRLQALIHVVLPQVFRIATPAMSTFALTLLKDSSLPSVIGVQEISRATTAVARSTGDALLAYTAAAVFYLVLSVAMALVARGLNSRLKAGA